MKQQDPRIALACASGESVFLAGESGPVWRVVEGLVRLDRDDGALRQPVQLALAGDLIGVESLCGSPYRFSATAFTASRLEPVRLEAGAVHAAVLQQAFLQQQSRCQDMASLRTGNVPQRVRHLLHLMGLEWPHGDTAWAGCADAIREALPALREVAQVVDAKTETVCRALAQLLPPRSRKTGPVRLERRRSAAPWRPPVPLLGMAA
jgi:hypothetical protein